MSSPIQTTKCLILGYYGARNLGDDMMLEAIIGWLQKQGRRVKVISENPSDTKTRFNVDSVQNTPLLLQWGWAGTVLKGRGIALLKELFQTDELVIGGGDLIRDTMGWRNFWYTIEKLLIAQLFGKSTYLVNVGIGTPTKTYSRYVLAYLLRRCQHVIVRDKRSLATCNTLGVSYTNLAPDIATILSDTHSREIRKPSIIKHKYCFVTLRTSPNVYSRYDIGIPHYTAFAKALDLLIYEKNLSVVFVPFQSNGNNDDNITHKEVYERLNNQARATVLEWQSDVARIFHLIAHSDLVIGMRLHAAIASVSVNTPCIVMPYDQKLDEFCALAGIKHVITPEKMLDPIKMTTLFNKALKGSRYVYNSIGSWQNLMLNYTDSKS